MKKFLENCPQKFKKRESYCKKISVSEKFWVRKLIGKFLVQQKI